MATTDRFPDALPHVLHLEGGWYPGTLAGDPNPTMQGVTQQTYDAWRTDHDLPLRTVRIIDPGELVTIYRTRYWGPIGAGQLAWPLCLYVFDSAVNHGLRRARRLRDEAAGDPARFLSLREFFYRRLGAQPARAKFLKGWLKRIAYLRGVT